MEARWAHNPEVAGSIPARATRGWLVDLYERGEIYYSRNARPRMSRRDWTIAIAMAFPSSLLLLLAVAVKLLG